MSITCAPPKISWCNSRR